MVLIILSNGFEDAEAIVPHDILMRGGAHVRFVSAEPSSQVTSARGIALSADCVLENVSPGKDDTVIIPGGSKGVAGILSNRRALDLIADAHHKGACLAAICAGPTVLARLGITDGKNVTCYPGCEQQMGSAICHADKSVCQDGKLITARAAGSSFDFGFVVLEAVVGKPAADKVRAEMVY